MFDVEGFILVGGQSSRMGADKAQLVINGQSLIEIIAAKMSAVATSVSLVGDHRTDRHVTLKNVPDTHPGWGALGGINAALGACRREWALIVACDLPLVTPELFHRLMSFAGDQSDAVVPIQPDGRPQPLCAFYRRESCVGESKSLIEDNEHTPRALLAKLQTAWIEFAQLEDLRGAADFFLNVNTPADFAAAKRLLEQDGR
ncbi:MAG TPA: molybdenum cofactor guanylyltransferase [Pyrinomonadaceae bacterium]|nr:molybdenum cofactor guanylyltransferase [Pyrinomonadaceae bacterium]